MALHLVFLLISNLCFASGQWALAWEDTFDGDSLNSSSWTVWNNQTHGSQEWELYLASAVTVAGGALTLTTSNAPPGTLGPDGKRAYAFTSGWVDTHGKVERTYGKYEARIRLPAPLRSVWPAYWLVDDTAHCWPVGGEIDILEAVGGFRSDAVFGTYHWGSKCGQDAWSADGQRNGASPHPPGANFSDNWHVFTAYWNASAITWSVDGSPYVSRQAGQPASLFVPSWPLYTIFNTALAFWGGGPQPPLPLSEPVTMVVDEVTIYEWAGPGGDTGHFEIPFNSTGLQPQ